MNTNTQTVDERCHYLAEQGMQNAILAHDYQSLSRNCHRFGKSQRNLVSRQYSVYSQLAADSANRIIAEREREASALRTNEARESMCRDCGSVHAGNNDGYCSFRLDSAGGAL
jgi:hypothetical protein